MTDVLSPAQQEVLDQLRARERPRPVWDPRVRDDLRAHLDAELGAIATDLERPLFVGKSTLGRLHACEAHHLAVEAEEFEWSVPAARGTVTHKAVELSVHLRGDPTPLDLVDTALARLEDDLDRPIGTFLRGLGDGERAELRGQVHDMVAKFVELWPPLQKRWVPRTESRARAELCGGKVILSGRVDLALGQPRGTEAGTLLVDFKTGRTVMAHLEDLRFYALLETLRCGVPPFRVASYELDAGTFSSEDVTEATLDAAVRRTVTGVTRLAELTLGLRSPTISASRVCQWCPASEGCPGAEEWAARDE